MYVELPPLHCVVVAGHDMKDPLVLEGGHKRKATGRMLDWAEGKAGSVEKKGARWTGPVRLGRTRGREEWAGSMEGTEEVGSAG